MSGGGSLIPTSYSLKDRSVCISLDLSLPPGAELVLIPVGLAAPAELPSIAQNWAECRRNTFAAGRRAARAALRAAGYVGHAELSVAEDGLPDWPPGWVGSISHSDQLAAAIVMRAADASTAILGIDVEAIITPEVAFQIAGAIIPEKPPRESGLGIVEEVTRAFSAKEALYKALYPSVRQYKDFSAAEICWQKGRGDRKIDVALKLTEAWGDNWPAGTVFQAFQTISGTHVITIVTGVF